MVSSGRVRHAGLMVIEVTRIGGDGSIRRAVVDTAGRDDAVRWERLAQQAALETPPYRPEPGQQVYQISAGGHAAQVAEKDLAGPLRELVSAMLSEGSHGQLISRPPRRTVLQARCPAIWMFTFAQGR